MTHSVLVFQDDVFQSNVYEIEYSTPQIYQSGIFDASVYDSGRELKSIINESVELLLKQFQTNAFDPSYYQSLNEALYKLIKILIINEPIQTVTTTLRNLRIVKLFNESISLQSFRSGTLQIAKIINESVKQRRVVFPPKINE